MTKLRGLTFNEALDYRDQDYLHVWQTRRITENSMKDISKKAKKKAVTEKRKRSVVEKAADRATLGELLAARARITGHHV